MELKDEDMEIKEESTNNEDQLLSKVSPLETHEVMIVEFCYVKYFGLEQRFRK